MTKKLQPVSPGEMLAEEFLKPLHMSNYRLAKEINVPPQRIGEIIAGTSHYYGGHRLAAVPFLWALGRLVAALAGRLRYADHAHCTR